MAPTVRNDTVLQLKSYLSLGLTQAAGSVSACICICIFGGAYKLDACLQYTYIPNGRAAAIDVTLRCTALHFCWVSLVLPTCCSVYTRSHITFPPRNQKYRPWLPTRVSGIYLRYLPEVVRRSLANNGPAQRTQTATATQHPPHQHHQQQQQQQHYQLYDYLRRDASPARDEDLRMNSQLPKVGN